MLLEKLLPIVEHGASTNGNIGLASYLAYFPLGHPAVDAELVRCMAASPRYL